jgi:hypothetical protein
MTGPGAQRATAARLLTRVVVRGRTTDQVFAAADAWKRKQGQSWTTGNNGVKTPSGNSSEIGWTISSEVQKKHPQRFSILILFSAKSRLNCW